MWDVVAFKPSGHGHSSFGRHFMAEYLLFKIRIWLLVVNVKQKAVNIFEIFSVWLDGAASS